MTVCDCEPSVHTKIKCFSALKYSTVPLWQEAVSLQGRTLESVSVSVPGKVSFHFEVWLGPQWQDTLCTKELYWLCVELSLWCGEDSTDFVNTKIFVLAHQKIFNIILISSINIDKSNLHTQELCTYVFCLSLAHSFCRIHCVCSQKIQLFVCVFWSPGP